MNRTYSEAMSFKNYSERLNYLQLLDGNVDSPREISYDLYNSSSWRRFRKQILLRDGYCDLADPTQPINNDVMIVHHINPLTKEDIINNSFKIWDPENVITTSRRTSNIIHYGEQKITTERYEGDTDLW